MTNPINTSASLAADTRGIETLRRAARENSPEALKETAKQFEGLFMNMMMKSMRDATASQEGIFDNQQSKMYTAMLDQQLSQNLASKGVGLADVLVRQLSSSLGTQPADGGLPGTQADKANPWQSPVTPQAPAASARTGNRPAHVQAFQDRVGAYAEEASRTTGIPAKFMMGQAALESGWGKREIRGADGSPSNNLFGIKAGPGWTGKVVEAVTTEYVNGVPQRRTEKFRAYDSYADSFRDYAKMLRNNPRYENVIANARDVNGFAQGLQRAGYATDPQYAAKLTQIITKSLSV
jgi:flagellar protein FlgJ